MDLLGVKDVTDGTTEEGPGVPSSVEVEVQRVRTPEWGGEGGSGGNSGVLKRDRKYGRGGTGSVTWTPTSRPSNVHEDPTSNSE